MTQGFYEQLRVEPSASFEVIRRAYAQVVAQLEKRRKAVMERGGDTSPLDLARAQADEAWEVLGNPVRRRRYDALRALSQQGLPEDGVDLWRKAGGAMVPPSAATAVELLRMATNLKVGALPPAPSRPTAPQPVREQDRTVTASSSEVSGPAPTQAPYPAAPATSAPATSPSSAGASSEPSWTGSPASWTGSAPSWTGSSPSEPASEPSEAPPDRSVVPLPGTAPESPSSGFQVVEGAHSAPVVMMPPADQGQPLSREDLARFVREHGYTGALLQAVRQARGVELEDISETTRISTKYLQAIEAEAFGELPSATFVRGYVREMARMLGMEEGAVVSGYMQRFSAG